MGGLRAKMMIKENSAMTTPPSSYPEELDAETEPSSRAALRARLTQWVALTAVLVAGLLSSLVIFDTARKTPPPMPAWMSPPPAPRAAPEPSAAVAEGRVAPKDESSPAPPAEKPLTQQASGSLARPAQLPVARPPEQTVNLAAGRFGLQLGVFGNPANAEELRRKLEQSGIPAVLEARVQAGPFASRAEADAARARLQRLGITDSILITEKKK